MSYYFIARIKIEDEKTYRKYLERADGVFAKYEGRYLAVDRDPAVLEGTWDYSRMVLIEFDTEEQFRDWYYSDEYQEILNYRLSASVCDTVLVKGLK